MLVREIEQRQTIFTGIHGPSRIVGVNNNYGFRAGSNKSFNMSDVGLPAVFWGGPIVNSSRAKFRQDSRVQGICRNRYKYLVIKVEKYAQCQINAFRGPRRASPPRSGASLACRAIPLVVPCLCSSCPPASEPAGAL